MKGEPIDTLCGGFNLNIFIFFINTNVYEGFGRLLSNAL